MSPTLRIFYSCPDCQLVKASCDVPEREDAEDAVAWMERTVRAASADHHRRSPTCVPDKLRDLLIPTIGRWRIGGPVVH